MKLLRVALPFCMLTSVLTAEEVHSLNGHNFRLADGLTVELVAATPLVDRPVSADFDAQGRLYVTDSSGSNAPSAEQVETRPHRIRRLVDSDGDGVFDKSTVYADKLMFPEGALFYEGSLYVAAPPEIWKFTDADDDGVAENREVWFDGKTLTGCANDLHGPYLGPDGWIYWCKGAFAEQTYDRPGRSPLVTTASHMFRRRPEGGPIESVMTGGMDNPVEVVFTPEGERIFTTTFLTHPANGQRDGLIHAVYGGVYGKDHRVLKGHARTGDLMPVLSHLGAAAPCGLARLETDGLGPGYRDAVMATSFNLHKVIGHSLSWDGAGLHAELSDLISSDNLDFHPTDVLEDADGSVIVVDTGGWFRLCCPTSQLEKADVLGGIYRVRRKTSESPEDPRGNRIRFHDLTSGQLAALLADSRPAVRLEAKKEIGRRDAVVSEALMRVIQEAKDPDHRREAVWATSWVDTVAVRAVTRMALNDPDTRVQHAALHVVSVHRDMKARSRVAEIVQSGPASLRRVAAETLGRLGGSEQVAGLLTAVPTAVIQAGFRRGQVDRILEHSLIYAAIEINDPVAVRRVLGSDDPIVKRAALIALDQMDATDLRAEEVAPLLTHKDAGLQNIAWWIVEQHADWADITASGLKLLVDSPGTEVDQWRQIQSRLVRFAGAPAVQQIMADGIVRHKDRPRIQRLILRAMADSGQKPLPANWSAPVVQCLSDTETAREALTVLNRLAKSLSPEVMKQLGVLAGDSGQDSEIRLRALNQLPASQRLGVEGTREFVFSQLEVNNKVTNRSLAVDFLQGTPLTSDDLISLTKQLPETGPLELRPILTVYSKSKDQAVGRELVSSLLKSPAATSLFPDQIQSVVDGYGAETAEQAVPLLKRIAEENSSRIEKLQEVLALVPKADIRRGLKVFQSEKASCLACHQRGYIGGRIGPGLNNIGRVRSHRDLVESILFPSLSFVRSYEPIMIVTTDGKQHNGLLKSESAESVTLLIDARKTVEIQKSEIEIRHPGRVSVMPAGLDKQLTPQQLADLVKYLKEG